MTPGLSIYRSNRLDVLAQLLAWLVQQPKQRPRDPITPLRIAVGNTGIIGWLEHQLAERWGVVSNVEFLFPTRAFSEASSYVLSQTPAKEVDTWSPEVLCWTILEILHDVLKSEDPVYAPLRNYLDADNHHHHPPDQAYTVTARAYGLARQIADVFDHYVMYRSELVLSWGRGETPKLRIPSSLAWQPALWQQVVTRIGEDHAAAHIHALHTAPPLADGSEHQTLRIFGLSSLSPALLNQAAALARYLPVELFLLCPSNVYWADLHAQREHLSTLEHPSKEAVDKALEDTEPANPLLVTLGRSMRDFQIALESLPDTEVLDRHDLFVDWAKTQPGPSEAETGFVDPAPPEQATALARLQSDILHARLTPQQPLSSDDRSIQFHGCHGPTRQVEVLREILLGLFADHPTLEPREVIVMCPDIGTFAPLISTVFEPGLRTPRTNDKREAPDWGPTGAPHLPYAITDLSLRQTNPVAEALLALLNLPDSRLTAPDLATWLSLEPIRRRFKIDLEDLSTLRDWIRESGMRWGADADDRQAAGQPPEILNTLQFGLDRLLIGTCLDEQSPLNGIRPYDRTTPGDGPLLGYFAEFITQLIRLRNELRTPRSVRDWVLLLLGDGPSPGVLNRFTAMDHDDAWLVWQVHEVIEQLSTEAATIDQTLPIDVAALRIALTERFERPSYRTPVTKGRIMFSSLVPMRGLPHRVVCLLGMDEDIFPRRSGRSAFDLRSVQPQLGDHDPSTEDRSALLEAVLAASDHLVVLYTGRDPRSNEPRPPAVPIQELRDTLDASFEPVDSQAPSKHLTTEHPLQTFSPRNFGSEGAPFSFDQRLVVAAEAVREAQRKPSSFYRSGDLPPLTEAEAPASIELDTLSYFLRAPHAELLRRRFGLSEEEVDDNPLLDREPLDVPTGLELWQLQQELLLGQLEGGASSTIEEQLKAEGRLPLGEGADVALRDPRRRVETLADNLGKLPKPTGELTIKVQLHGRSILGQLTKLRGGSEVVCRFRPDSTTRAWTWVLGPWVRLLGRQLMAPDDAAKVVVLHANDSGPSPKPQWRSFALPDGPAEAGQYLYTLLSLYDRGQQTPIPLFPQSSFCFAYATRQTWRSPPGEDETATEEALEDFRKRDPETYQKAVLAVRKAWSPSHGRGDIDDPAIARLFSDYCPAFCPDQPDRFDPDFVRTALAVWQPIIAARKAPRKAPSLGASL